MDYSFKVTTHGRAILAACMAQQAPPVLLRVAFGSGRIEEEANLADQHELIQFVSDGTIGRRWHEADHLGLTIQYENLLHKDVPMFYLSEFMIYIADPVTGAETDFIYATLGDYIQPIPAYRDGVPATKVEYSLQIVISDELQVSVSAPAGLVTYSELNEMIRELATTQQAVTIPADGWQESPDGGAYAYRADIPVESVTVKLIPQLFYPPESAERAGYYGLSPVCETLDGVLRVWSKAVPAEPIPAVLNLTGDASGYFAVGDGSTGGGTYTLPPATENTLGGVKIGSGLNVTRDGTLSVNAATEAEVNEMLTGVLTPENK